MTILSSPTKGPSTRGASADDWRTDAACQGEMAVFFYPPLRTEKRSLKLARERRAKSVCASCPVRERCLEQAIRSGERYGIWGGLTDGERSHLRAS